MKSHLVLFASLALVFTPGFHAAAQSGKTGYEIRDIKIDTPISPSYTSDYQKRSRNEKWIEIEVQFAVDPDFTEELTFKYFVYLPELGQKVLVGEVTHSAIVKGREKYSIMYVSPKALAFVLGGKAVSSSTVQHVGIQVLKQGQLVAEASSQGAPKGQWWQTVQQVPGYLLNKDQTPFGPIAWDRFEAIKAPTR